MTDPNEQKALQKIEEGERKLKKNSGFFASLLGSGDNVSEAIECFISGGNYFKIAKNWDSAGKIFLKVAELREQHGGATFEAAQQYVEAGTCYRKVDTQKAIDCHTKGADIYAGLGKFISTAKARGTMGEIYETAVNTEIDNNLKEQYKEKAMIEHQKAADFYKGEEQKSSAAKHLQKVASLAAELGQYQKAMHVFEEIALYEVESQLLKYSSRAHFLQALLCSLCYDLLDAQRALKRYEEIAPIFSDSDECKFFKKLIRCVEMNDPDGFAQVVKERDEKSRFDAWYTNILLKIKRTCGDGGEVKDDDGGQEEEEDLR